VSASGEIRYITHPHPVSGVTNSKLAIWCFLASEVMLFGALFSAYILIRSGAPSWPRGHDILNVPLATLNTMILITSSVTMVMSWAALAMKNLGKFRLYMAVTILLGIGFLVVKGFEYSSKFHHHHYPSTDIFYATYFTLTGVHGVHVILGLIVNTYFLFTAGWYWKKNPDMLTGRIEACGLYWHFVDLVWIFLFPALYLI
jgi:heme/copper-type cytochrome/quinol oxidase subunit 3